MRSRPIAVAVLAAALAACTGGGGAPPRTSIPPTPTPTPTPDPSPTPAPTTPTPTPAAEQEPTPSLPRPPPPPPSDPDPPPLIKSEPRGAITAPGIDRIPLSAIKLTNEQVASRFAIIESKGPRWGNPDGYSPRFVRRIAHLDDVRIIACHAFIRACPGNPHSLDYAILSSGFYNRPSIFDPVNDPISADAPFQTHLGVRYPVGDRYPREWRLPEDYSPDWPIYVDPDDPKYQEYIYNLGVRHYDQMRSVVDNFRLLSRSPSSVKIVSSSYIGLATPGAMVGARLPFASIEPAGNHDAETVWHVHVGQGDPEFAYNYRNLRAAIADDKVLLVAGYAIDNDNDITNGYWS